MWIQGRISTIWGHRNGDHRNGGLVESPWNIENNGQIWTHGWNMVEQSSPGLSIRCPHLCPQCCSYGHTARPPGGCTGLRRGAQKAAGKSYRILLVPGCTQVFWHALNSECVYHYRIDTRGQLMNYMHDVTLYENFSLRATSAAPQHRWQFLRSPPHFVQTNETGTSKPHHTCIMWTCWVVQLWKLLKPFMKLKSKMQRNKTANDALYETDHKFRPLSNTDGIIDVLCNPHEQIQSWIISCHQNNSCHCNNFDSLINIYSKWEGNPDSAKRSHKHRTFKMFTMFWSENSTILDPHIYVCHVCQSENSVLHSIHWLINIFRITMAVFWGVNPLCSNTYVICVYVYNYIH